MSRRTNDGMGRFTVLNVTESPAEPDVLLFSVLDPSVLVVGTYHLEENGNRAGSLLLYHVCSSSLTWFLTCVPTTKDSQLKQTIQCPSGVLDAKWACHTPENLLVALSNGCIAVYKLSLDDVASPFLSQVTIFQHFQPSALVLSLAVQPTSPSVLATLSTGEISIVHPESYLVSKAWKAHNLEVWCGAWKNPDVVLTGGDDALLKIWDLRDDSQRPQAVSKSHGAGLVSLLTLSDTLFLTGSYDNSLRSFDYRNMKGPVSSIDLEGGVWRILPRPNSTTSSFLTCCMQFGAQLVSLNQETGLFKGCGTFEPQENRRLIYGASWHSENVAAVCSFYEKNVYICRIP